MCVAARFLIWSCSLSSILRVQRDGGQFILYFVWRTAPVGAVSSPRPFCCGIVDQALALFATSERSDDPRPFGVVLPPLRFLRPPASGMGAKYLTTSRSCSSAASSKGFYRSRRRTGHPVPCPTRDVRYVADTGKTFGRNGAGTASTRRQLLCPHIPKVYETQPWHDHAKQIGGSEERQTVVWWERLLCKMCELGLSHHTSTIYKKKQKTSTIVARRHCSALLVATKEGFFFFLLILAQHRLCKPPIFQPRKCNYGVLCPIPVYTTKRYFCEHC